MEVDGILVLWVYPGTCLCGCLEPGPDWQPSHRNRLIRELVQADLNDQPVYSANPLAFDSALPHDLVPAAELAEFFGAGRRVWEARTTREAMRASAMVWVQARTKVDPAFQHYGIWPATGLPMAVYLHPDGTQEYEYVTPGGRVDQVELGPHEDE